MIAFDLQPTDENLLKTFMSDSIGRNRDLYDFIDILDTVDGPYTIALDGGWGSGKTFFVKQSKMLLDACNPYLLKDTDDEINEIQKIWKEANKGEVDRALNPQVAVYYDAWANDHCDDPIASLVYEIIVAVNSDFTFSESETGILDVGASLIELASGRSATQFLEILNGQDGLEKIKKSISFDAQVRKFLNSVLEERGDRLVVFIDELDRCKPSFAVGLLERIKHYFDNDRITFVISVNIAELINTVKHHYGYGFNASKYIDRFFDLRLELPPPDMDKYYRLLDINSDSYIYNSVTCAVIEHYNFTMREIAHYKRMLVSAYNPLKKESASFDEEKGRVFCISCIVPIMIGLKIHNMVDYIDFKEGRNGSPLFEIINKCERRTSMCRYLLNTNETFETVNQSKNYVDLREKVNELYDALFVKNYNFYNYKTTIGEISITKKTKAEVLNIVDMLPLFKESHMQ